ncbi:hypothetical protein SNE510_43370 [Streptomyces sp. NE5-10]|uniref:hypothetical protein n=1 Tax=Streptomyces sp. NE5-10 TaxID=2759674 RepID=UPI0019072A8A|nr:hypothetical protein [Streptomyces sp. NE5-10]GHJ94818.1 hypothetical protein SNE510_43370 [Streptomyces sp. NE5-10]
MRTALRTALATALVAGVAAAPVLTAGSAFAATPAPTAATTAPAKTAAKTAAKPAAAAATTAPATQAPAPAAPATTAPAADAADTAPDADVLVRTVALDGGLTAKVYNRGTQHRYFTATVLRGTTVLGELKAGGGYGGEETKVFSGYAVTLDAEGEVTAVEAGPEHATLVRTDKLLSGTVAKIYKLQEQNWFAELFRGGDKVGELHAVTRSVAGQDNGEYLVLNPDGSTHNWIGNSAPAKLGHYRLADGTIVEVGQKDGHYGLRTVDPATGEGGGFLYLTAGDRKVYFLGKAVVVLESPGSFAAFVPGQKEQSAPQPYNLETGKVDHCLPTSIEFPIGAGTQARLTMTTKGPKAKLVTAGDEKVIGVLDRAHPSLPASAGIIARIDGAFTATPSLYAKVEGGDAEGSSHPFPALPKGCVLETVPAGGTQTGGTTGTGTQTQGGQTSVVPRGGVAAGVEPTAEEGSATLLAVGAGAASLAAAGLGFTVLRRRAVAARG